MKLATEPAEKSQAFWQMRELTIIGYFTSELVGKTVLHYDPVPGATTAASRSLKWGI